MLHIALLYFIAHVDLTSSTRCCQYFCDKSACEGALEYGCKWLEKGVDDALIVNDVQCRSLLYGNCGECCPECPPSKGGSAPPECPNTQECPKTPSQPQYAEMTPPASILAEITADETPGCSSNSKNCLDTSADTLFNPTDIVFDGVEYSESLNACCYSYVSTYVKNARIDCKGKNPSQSHITMDIDCDSNLFTIVPTAAGATYGNDGSTCYTGLKIDKPCSSVCSYQICLAYSNLLAGECPTTKSWIMDKAGPTFSFGALDGIPSCNAQTSMSKGERHAAVGMDDGKQRHNNANVMVSVQPISMQYWLFIGAIFMGIMAYGLYKRACANVEEKGKLLADEDNSQYYSTA